MLLFSGETELRFATPMLDGKVTLLADTQDGDEDDDAEGEGTPLAAANIE